MEIKLIIGLGNNDTIYTNTYHNVGFLMTDYLTKQNTLKIPMIKPEGYMNNSGLATKKALQQYKITPEKILVIHDDSDIELGKYKFAFNRSSAGHKGVQNIIDQLVTQEFHRLRIGIRPKEKEDAPHQKAETFVLKKISRTNAKILETVFEKSGNEIVKMLG